MRMLPLQAITAAIRVLRVFVLAIAVFILVSEISSSPALRLRFVRFPVSEARIARLTPADFHLTPNRAEHPIDLSKVALTDVFGRLDLGLAGPEARSLKSRYLRGLIPAVIATAGGIFWILTAALK